MRIPLMLATVLMIGLSSNVASPAGDKGWLDLAGDNGLDGWKIPRDSKWVVAGKVGLDPKNPKMLAYQPGSGVLVNGPSGRTGNIVSKQKFGDIEVHLEFMIPKGSNSGVKFE